jgi:EmrB/QacA subfamily drug resistance transporter
MTTGSGVSAQPAQQEDGSGARQWLMLSVLLLGQFMGLLDVTIVNVAMPSIGHDLDTTGAALQLVVGGYTVAYAMLLITGARLGDLFGRRRMYMLGAAGFTAASLICGIAPNIEILVIARFVQGAFAAVMVPQIMSVIQMQFAGAARAKALSAYGLVLSAGGIVGLTAGGLLVSANLWGISWRPAFLINVPLGIILLALVPKMVTKDAPRGTRKLDFVGLSIAVPSVFLVVLPLVLGHEVGWPAWTFICIAAGLILAVLFVPVQRRILNRGGDPLLNLDVLKASGMPSGLTTLMCMQVTYGGFLFAFALHLQAGLGDSALRAGLTYIPMSVAFGLVGFYWRKLSASMHHLLPSLGLVLCVLAFLGLSATMRDGSQATGLMWASLVVYGVGMGASFSPLLTQTLVHVPMQKAPDASGLYTTTMQLGQLIGVAAFGTIFLSLVPQFAPNTPTGVQTSASAITTTLYWLAVLAAVGVVASIVLARTVLRAKRAAAAAA